MQDALTPEEEIEFAELEAQGYGKGIVEDVNESGLTPEEEIEFAELEAQGFGAAPIQESAKNYNSLTGEAYPRGYVPADDRGSFREGFDNIAGGIIGFSDDIGLTEGYGNVKAFTDAATDLPVIGEAAKMAGAQVGSLISDQSADEIMEADRGRRAAQREDHPISSGMGDMTSYAMLPNALVGGGMLKGAAKLGALEGTDTYMETGDIDTAIKTGLTMTAAGYGLGMAGKVAFGAGKLAMGGKAKAAKAVSEGIKSMNRGSMMKGAGGMAWRSFQRNAPKYLDKIAKGEKGAVEKYAVALQKAESQALKAEAQAVKHKVGVDNPVAPMGGGKADLGMTAPTSGVGSPILPSSGPGFTVKPKILDAKVKKPTNHKAIAKERDELSKEYVKKLNSDRKLAEKMQELADAATKKKMKDSLRDAFTLGRAGAGNIITEITKNATNTHYQKMSNDKSYRKAYMKAKLKDR